MAAALTVSGPPGRLHRQGRRPARRLARGLRARGGRDPRGQRGRKVDAAARDLRPAAAPQRHDRLRGRGDQRPRAAPDRPGGDRPRPRGPRDLRPPVGRREPAPGRDGRRGRRGPPRPACWRSSRCSTRSSTRHAGELSGGQQQMLAIARGLMSSPTPADARRALARALAQAGGRGDGAARPDPRRARGDRPARRAERGRRGRRRRPRLRDAARGRIALEEKAEALLGSEDVLSAYLT